MNAPWDLIDGYLDGQLASEQEVQFQDWLKSDPEHLRCFVREVHFHQSLRAEFEALRTVPAVLPFPRAIEESAPAPFPQRSRKIFSLHWKPVLALAASIALVAAALELFLPSTPQPTIAGDSRGSIEVERAGQRLVAAPGFKFLPSDLVTVAGTNSATLTYTSERTDLELAPGSKLKLTPSHLGKRFHLIQGELRAAVAPQPFGKPMILRTSHAEARVIGTQFALFEEAVHTRLEVAEGRVQLKQLKDGAKIEVRAGSYALAGNQSKLVAQPITGKVFREFWLDLRGDNLMDLTDQVRYPNSPSGHDFPSSFQSNTNWSSAYGTRTRGYLLPPVNGDYEFRISGNGQVRLWLSPDEDPTDRVVVGQIFITRNRPGDERPETTPSRQESGPIPLEAGRHYYIEAIHKYGDGKDLLTVTWKRPNGTEEPIPAEFLAPFPFGKSPTQ